MPYRPSGDWGTGGGPSIPYRPRGQRGWGTGGVSSISPWSWGAQRGPTPASSVTHQAPGAATPRWHLVSPPPASVTHGAQGHATNQDPETLPHARHQDPPCRRGAPAILLNPKLHRDAGDAFAGGGLRDGDGVLSAFQDPRVTGQGAGTGDGYLGGCGAGADGAFWG